MINWQSELVHLSLQVRHAEEALGTALAADSLGSCRTAFLAEVGRTGRQAGTLGPGTHAANTDCSWVSLHVDENHLMDIRTAVAQTEDHRSEGRKAGHDYTFRYLDLRLLFANDGFPDLLTAVALPSTCDGVSYRGWRPAMGDHEESGCDGDFHGRYVWAVEVTVLRPRSDLVCSWHSLCHGFLHVDAPSPAAESASVDERDRDGIPQYPLFFDVCLWMAVSYLCEMHDPFRQAMANDVVDGVCRRNRRLTACPPECLLPVQVEET